MPWYGFEYIYIYMHICVYCIISPSAELLIVCAAKEQQVAATYVRRSKRFLKASSAGFSVFFKRARWPDGWILCVAKLLLPLLFFLSMSRLEGGSLAAVEIQRCAFEESDVLCDENVLHGRSWFLC